MENILLRYFRESNNFSAETIAARLGIEAEEYNEIENGNTLLGYKCKYS